MPSTVNTIKLAGIDAVPVKVECEITTGVGIHLVGLADAAVKESLLRTITALQAKGYRIPGKKITIRLAPTDIAKTGTHYDLPIALAILAASGQENLPNSDKWLVVGELGLDGSVRPVDGCVQAALAVKNGDYNACIIPSGNVQEVACLLDKYLDKYTPVYGAETLDEAVRIIGSSVNRPAAFAASAPGKNPGNQSCWDDPAVAGNAAGRRAIEIAAAGGHPLLMMGTPGPGRTTLGKALCELLPPMDIEEAVEVAKIYSASGRSASPYTDSLRRRPFRAPHHASSLAAMFGGGAAVRPGEVSLAHNGVLMFDDIAETPKSLLEAIAAAMEDKSATLRRLNSKTVYPADFLLVAAMNPCPCGHYGEGDRCTCTPGQRQAYLSKLSARLYDRITLQTWIHPVIPGNEAIPAEDVETVRERVHKARERQRERYEGRDYRLNDELPAKALDEFCRLDAEGKELIEKLINGLGLSARAYTRILKIARTIADLEESYAIFPKHLLEAASFRFLDREAQDS